MLAPDCDRCSTGRKIRCNLQFITAEIGDPIYCPIDGSRLVVRRR